MAVVLGHMDLPRRCTTIGANRISHCRSQTARHQGLVKHVDRSKGFGFIQCDEVHKQYGSDVFVRVCDLLEHGVGDSVCFSLSESKRGQPQGTELKPCAKTSNKDVCGDDASQLTNSGMIKSFDAGRGYGFIDCAETFEKYQRDVFVHKDQLGNFEVGDKVSFQVRPNSAGHPRAWTLTPKLATLAWLGEPEAPTPQEMPSVCHQREAEASSEAPLTAKQLGKVKNINSLKACGFIECEVLHKQFGRDVFFPLALLPDLSVGDLVEFQARVKSGQPQASSITRVDVAMHAAENSTERPLSEKYAGKVKIINEVKACGFIECEVLHKRFGSDVFFPLTLLPGLSVGDHVEFQARVKSGQPQACSVTRVDMAMLAAKAQSVKKAEKGACPDATKQLLRACQSSNKDSYSRMFEALHAGADPNARDVTGQTALMVSAFNAGGSEKKCRLLVGMGAEVHAIYKGDVTVLQWAKERIGHKFAAHLDALSRGEQIDCTIAIHNMGGGEV